MWLYGSGFPKSMNIGNKLKQWNGWGTCLKPAYEPIIVARKPFKGSLVDNVLQNGVGGLNIDECQVGSEIIKSCGGRKNTVSGDERVGKSLGYNAPHEPLNTLHNGRFPANVIHDGSDEVCAGMPNTKKGGSITKQYDSKNEIYGKRQIVEEFTSYGDEGSAARYFYCAKASKKDRDEGLDMFEYQEMKVTNQYNLPREDGSNRDVPLKKNIHPTVKPTELMQYLVRLVTPKGGTILDPFTGSGSTGKAVMYENKERNADYNFIGFEINEEYCEIANARIKAVI